MSSPGVPGEGGVTALPGATGGVLGTFLSSADLQPNPSKTETVLAAPTAQDVEELQSHLGSVNLYRGFMPNLSGVLHPLNCLLVAGTC